MGTPLALEDEFPAGLHEKDIQLIRIERPISAVGPVGRAMRLAAPVSDPPSPAGKRPLDNVAGGSVSLEELRLPAGSTLPAKDHDAGLASNGLENAQDGKMRNR